MKLGPLILLHLIHLFMLGACGEIIKESKEESVESEPATTRGMWVWNFSDVLGDTAQQHQLLAEGQAAKVTDLYVFLRASDYQSRDAEIRAFIIISEAASIHVWGLEGYRGYFSDASGPSELFAAADELIAFNARGQANEGFVGFHNDLEPQDGQGDFPDTFHNNLADSALNTASGGVWKATEALDRAALMEDWLTTEGTLKERLKNAGLRLGIDMPSWIDNYFGENVKVTFKGQNQGLMEAMMAIADDYVVMSYSTEPDYVIAKVIAELNYADTLAGETRPRVYGGIETHAGVESSISYADTPAKATRTSALSDLRNEILQLQSHPSFAGMCLHDWIGWRDLAP